jgi:predicted MFS family arabinose efflux permease
VSSEPAALRPRTRTVLISAATAFSLLGDQVLYSVLPVYRESLGLTALQVGLLLAANRIVRLVTNDIARRVSMLLPQRTLLSAALALGAITTMLYTQTQLFTVLLSARLAWGLSWSFIRHIGVLRIMDDTPGDRAGRTMGIYNGISRVGSTVGLFGGAILVDWLGFIPALWILAVASAIAVPLAWWGHGANQITEAPQAPSKDGAPWPFLTLGFTLGAVGPGFVMATFGAVLAEYTSDEWLVTAATLTGGVLALRFFLDSAAAPWLGSLTDQLGVRHASSLFFLAGGIVLLIAGVVSNMWLIIALVIVFFICGTALQAGIAGTVGKRGSGAFARYVTAADFGSAVGPVVGWVVLDWLDVTTVGLTMGGVCYVAAAAVALRFVEAHDRGRPR